MLKKYPFSVLLFLPLLCQAINHSSTSEISPVSGFHIQTLATPEDMMRRRTCFKEGFAYLSFGTGIYGLANPMPREHDVLLNFKNSSLPPLFIKYEYAINDFIGIGGTAYMRIQTYKWERNIDVYNEQTWQYDSTIYSEKYSGVSFGLLGRACVHFGTSKSSDPYAAIGIGYEFIGMKLTTNDPAEGKRTPSRPLPFAGELMLGFRHYFSDNTGFYVEAGFGKMLLNFGITIALE